MNKDLLNLNSYGSPALGRQEGLLLGGWLPRQGGSHGEGAATTRRMASMRRAATMRGTVSASRNRNCLCKGGCHNEGGCQDYGNWLDKLGYQDDGDCLDEAPECLWVEI